MRQKQHDPLHGGSGPGLDDFAGSGKSGPQIPHYDLPKQAASRRLQRQRAVERVHRLGPRVMDEVGRRHPEIAADLDRRLERYAERLSPCLLRTTGGDRFPLSPMRVIGRAR